MAQQSTENKKLDISNLPRGAIGIKGLPVSRNTRLPSIRSPRDLTLGAQPKRTFIPNIPIRREKKSNLSENATLVNQEFRGKIDGKLGSPASDRGRGKNRSKVIIQSQGSIFSEGIGSGALSRKEKAREAFQKSDYTTSSSSRGMLIKKERADRDVAGVSSRLDNLFRDDFIDDDMDIDESALLKPIIFPPSTCVKKETKCEEAKQDKSKSEEMNFDPDTAKEMNFDVKRVAKLIKKEKGIEKEEVPSVSSKVQSNDSMSLKPEERKSTLAEDLANEVISLLETDEATPKLVLLKLPQIINVSQKMDDTDASQKRPSSLHKKSSDNQNTGLTSIKGLPEGYIGKLQIMKSGKTRLLVGPIEYTLDSISTLRNAKHELVSIKTNSNTGDLCVLGCVNDMLKFVPDEDSLLG